MSRAIQIKVSESVTRTIHVDDEVRTGIGILPLLPPASTEKNLGEVLEEHGFKKDEEGWTRQDSDGVTVRVTTEVKDGNLTPTVSASIESETQVTEKGEATTWGDTDYGDNADIKSRAKKELQKKLEAKIDDKQKKDQERVTATLEKKLEGLRGEINDISRKTNTKNLREKASQLGEVREEQTTADGGISIRVKL